MVFLRALLGIAEAAFGPGVPFYLSLFYRREELAFRTGLFISAAPLATAYAGFLAYAITSIPSPIAPWRLLFILEGFPSIIAGIAAFYMIPDSPGDAWFLNNSQRDIARRRLLVVRDDDEEDDDDQHSIMKRILARDEEEEGRGIRWSEIWVAMKNPGNWITAVCIMTLLIYSITIILNSNISSSSLSSSSPTFPLPVSPFFYPRSSTPSTPHPAPPAPPPKRSPFRPTSPLSSFSSSPLTSPTASNHAPSLS